MIQKARKMLETVEPWVPKNLKNARRFWNSVLQKTRKTLETFELWDPKKLEQR